jgi:hypothetical protein
MIKEKEKALKRESNMLLQRYGTKHVILDFQKRDLTKKSESSG